MASENYSEVKSVEEQAFELLFREYYSRLCCFANRFISNMPESEEIVQEVFLKIWKRKNELQLDNRLSSYLFKSVQNLCLNFIEHRKIEDNYYEVIELLYKDNNMNFNVYESVLFNELQQNIDKAVNSLPDECRKIFSMSRQDGLKYTEIAEKLNISVKTVETQISRALTKLKFELKDFLVLFIISFLLNR